MKTAQLAHLLPDSTEIHEHGMPNHDLFCHKGHYHWSKNMTNPFKWRLLNKTKILLQRDEIERAGGKKSGMLLLLLALIQSLSLEVIASAFLEPVMLFPFDNFDNCSVTRDNR